MEVYVEGSVRLRWIDRMGRTAGSEKPDFWVHLRGDNCGGNVAFQPTRSSLAQISLDERIGLESAVDVGLSRDIGTLADSRFGNRGRPLDFPLASQWAIFGLLRTPRCLAECSGTPSLSGL